jgi:hypothetical protein
MRCLLENVLIVDSWHNRELRTFILLDWKEMNNMFCSFICPRKTRDFLEPWFRTPGEFL